MFDYWTSLHYSYNVHKFYHYIFYQLITLLTVNMFSRNTDIKLTWTNDYRVTRPLTSSRSIIKWLHSNTTSSCSIYHQVSTTHSPSHLTCHADNSSMPAALSEMYGWHGQIFHLATAGKTLWMAPELTFRQQRQIQWFNTVSSLRCRIVATKFGNSTFYVAGTLFPSVPENDWDGLNKV